jgi:hypothetical protein
MKETKPMEKVRREKKAQYVKPILTKHKKLKEVTAIMTGLPGIRAK